MIHLIEFILAFPHDNMVRFLNALQDPFKKDILLSLIAAAVYEKNMPVDEEKKVLEFFTAIANADIEKQEFVPDPLMIEMMALNKELLAAWNLGAKEEKEFSQDDRLDILINLVQTCLPSEDVVVGFLLQTLDHLSQTYMDFNCGYAANTITSLYTVIKVAAEERKKGVKNAEEKDEICAVVKELQKQHQVQTKEMQKIKLRKANYLFEVCSLVSNHKEEKHIDMCCLLDFELKLFKMILESFIDDSVRHDKENFPEEYSSTINPSLKMLVDLGDVKHPIHCVIAKKEGVKKILAQYELALLFQGVLYDKGKNAEQRLDAFLKVYMSQSHKLREKSGNESIDNTTKIFLENISVILNARKAYYLLPSGNWRFNLFSQVLACSLTPKPKAPVSNRNLLQSKPK
jgi:hypothetical protein